MYQKRVHIGRWDKGVMKSNNVELSRHLLESDIRNPYKSVLLLWFCTCWIRNELPENELNQFEKIDPANRLLLSMALSIATFKHISVAHITTSEFEKIVEDLFVIVEDLFGLYQPSPHRQSFLEKKNYYDLKTKILATYKKDSSVPEIDCSEVAKIILKLTECSEKRNDFIVISIQLRALCERASTVCSEIISRKIKNNQVNERLIAGIFEALNRLSTEDEYLLRNSLSERCLAHKLASKLSNIFPEYDVDVEYNRFEGEPKFVKAYEADLNKAFAKGKHEFSVDGNVRVYPDIIIHKRGQPINAAVFEVKRKSQCSESQRLFDIFKLKKYSDHRNPLKYSSAVFVNLDDKQGEASFMHDVEIYQDQCLVFSNRKDMLTHNQKTEWDLCISDSAENSGQRNGSPD